jgi:hypothetical protein
MGTKFNFYRGKLSPKQAAEGMNAAAQNAKRLCEDAQLLFEARKFPTACALAILSIEESGKLPFLREIACVKDKKAHLAMHGGDIAIIARRTQAGLQPS